MQWRSLTLSTGYSLFKKRVGHGWAWCGSAGLDEKSGIIGRLKKLAIDILSNFLFGSVAKCCTSHGITRLNRYFTKEPNANALIHSNSNKKNIIESQ